MSWEYFKIKDICLIHGGNPSPKEQEFASVGIPFIKMKDLGKYHHTTSLEVVENRIPIELFKTRKFKVIKKGSVVIPRSGSVGLNHRGILAFDSVIVSHICALEVIDDKVVFNKFLYYYLTTIDMVNITKQTTGLDAITFEDLAQIKIPLPPLATQKRIAEILDAADALRRKDQELLKKYDELAQAIFIDMFGDPVKNEKGWKRKVATDYYEVRGRVGWKGYKKTDLRLNGAIVLGATHVTNTGEIDLTKVVYLSQEKFNESPEIKVQKDDLIFVQRGNTIGKVALTREDLGEATINPVVLIFRPVNVNPIFLLYLILNKEQNRELVNSNSGSAQPMITQEFMRKYFYIDIKRDDQEEFAKRIEIAEEQKAKARISFKKTESLFLTLIQKAFKGELVA